MRCGGPARPAILMFGDMAYVEDDGASERWDGWREALVRLAPSKQYKVVVLEAGCGCAVRPHPSLGTPTAPLSAPPLSTLPQHRLPSPPLAAAT